MSHPADLQISSRAACFAIVPETDASSPNELEFVFQLCVLSGWNRVKLDEDIDFSGDDEHSPNRFADFQCVRVKFRATTVIARSLTSSRIPAGCLAW